MIDFPNGFPWLRHFVEGQPAAQAALAAAARRRVVPKGTVLVEEDQRSDALRLVAEGELLVDLDVGGRRLSLGSKKPGDFVGELGVVDPGPSTAKVVAGSDATVHELTHAAYTDLRRTSPRAAGALLSAICCDLARRLRRSSQMTRTGRPGVGESLVPQLSAMHGVDRATIDPVHVPRSAHGHTAAVGDAKVLQALKEAGAFRVPSNADAAYQAALSRDIERIAYFLGVQVHKPGDVIVRAGETADGVFVVLEGRVRVEAGKPDAWFHVDRELGPGNLFGHLAFFDDGHRAATVTALTPLRLAVLYPAAVQMLLTMSEEGQPLGVHLIDWFARQLVADARHLHDRLRERVVAETA